MALELRRLVGVVAEQGDAVGAEREQHLRRGGVVALVLAVAEREVGLVGVEAGVLQGVGVELGVQADAPALLAEVEQEPAGRGDPLDRLAQLRAAVAALGAEDVAGQALAVRPHERRVAAGGAALERTLPVAEGEGEVLPAVGQPVEGQDAGGRGVAVGEAQRDGDRGAHAGRRLGREVGERGEHRRGRRERAGHVSSSA